MDKKSIFQLGCQPIFKSFSDSLPVWGNPDLILHHFLRSIKFRVDVHFKHSDFSLVILMMFYLASFASILQNKESWSLSFVLELLYQPYPNPKKVSKSTSLLSVLYLSELAELSEQGGIFLKNSLASRLSYASRVEILLIFS